jgi:hypothetical protein
VFPEPSKGRGNWMVHVVTHVGKGVGMWNTLLWGLAKAFTEVDMVCENVAEDYLFLKLSLKKLICAAL